MPNPLVECIPNFSEARRPEVVDAIVQSIQSVADVVILDRHSDLDHNRTVITYIGPPEGVEEAAFRAIATAAKRIDLEQHTGAHPRLGAADVIPFVPIRDITMPECVAMAQRLGKRVGDELGIPVYLYEEAATRPERKNLEDIRRGQYEALKAEIGIRPERSPDFGPAKVGPAGGAVIGARHPLIAFNVYLTTGEIAIAQKIAKAVRHSSGGLRWLKALGLLVEGRAQVSMNLTNYRQTPIARVVEMVRREAERYGVGIHHCELVGLVPQEALLDAAVWYTQLDQFTPEQILEHRLQAALNERQAEEAPAKEDFLNALAQGTATPGGGAAAAHAGAAGAALVAMVARLTVGKKKYAAVEARMREVIVQAEDLRAALSAAVAQDSRAFEAYMAASRLPKESPEQQSARSQAMQQATLRTIQVPLQVTRNALEVMRLAVEMARLGNVNAISDAASGAAMGRAALMASGLNVRINCPNLEDQPAARAFLDELRGLNEQAQALENDLAGIVTERGKLAF